MSRPSRYVMPALLSAALLVGVANLGAYAAPGKPLLLGKTNKASRTTTLTTGSGAALSLKVKKGRAPLKVNSTGRVANLNADQVDGFDASALLGSAIVYTIPDLAASGGFEHGFPGLAGGRYLVTYTVSGTTSTPDTSVLCQMLPADESGTFGLYGTSRAVDYIADVVGVTASGVVDTRAEPYVLNCDAIGGLFDVFTSDEIAPQVVFTPLETVTQRATVATGP